MKTAFSTGICCLSLLLLAGCSSKKSPVETPSSTAPTNHAPAAPSQPNPADYATTITVPCVFVWACSDPDQGDTLTYTVHIGPGSFTDTIPIVTTESFMANTLLANTNYLWRVTARDNHGAAIAGPTWHFRTQ